jgi:hypothetical protein
VSQSKVMENRIAVLEKARDERKAREFQRREGHRLEVEVLEKDIEEREACIRELAASLIEALGDAICSPRHSLERAILDRAERLAPNPEPEES